MFFNRASTIVILYHYEGQPLKETVILFLQLHDVMQDTDMKVKSNQKTHFICHMLRRHRFRLTVKCLLLPVLFQQLRVKEDNYTYFFIEIVSQGINTQ